jgi:hypothetical protein
MRTLATLAAAAALTLAAVSPVTAGEKRDDA